MSFLLQQSRFASRIHHAFVSKVEDAIAAAIEERAQYFDARKDGTAAMALRQTVKGGSPKLRLPHSMYTARDLSLDTFGIPDATFFHEEADSDCPDLVVEVSSSWRSKDTASPAESYTVCSMGGIACVLGFNINTGLGKSATASMWRSDAPGSDSASLGFICSQAVDAVAFRNAVGIAPSGSLELRLEDLLGPDAMGKLSPRDLSTPIALDFHHLCTMLSEAEGKSVVPRLQKHQAEDRLERRKRKHQKYLKDIWR